MYGCDNESKLKEYKMNLEKAIQQGLEYPEEEEMPEIYIIENRNINLQKNYGTPYYAEIDISLINATNTSSVRKTIYSDYERVMRSIPFILENRCRPISILKDGDIQYIENGKHRYLAHILLGKKIIPVSIREQIKEPEPDFSFIHYKRNLYNDDGHDISYPDEIIKFYENNKEIFECINHVKMEYRVENKDHQLTLRKSDNNVIEISNGVSAGNLNRSSLVAMELIKKCGFDIDEKFIETHIKFELEEKYDANNLKFDEKKDLSFDTTVNIKNHLNVFRKYESGDVKIAKLHSILSRFKLFNTYSTHMDIFKTGWIKMQEEFYYIISSIDAYDSKRIYTYVFSQEDDSESNLKTKFLGRTDYKNIFE